MEQKKSPPITAEDSSQVIRKSILIIKSNPNSLSDVENFLRNRDWLIGSTSVLKNAVLFAIQNKPSFMLLSVDHPNQKVQLLPQLLAKSFPCCTIYYAEKAKAAAMNALDLIPSDYKIYPPATGPAVERAVNKYIRDLQNKASKQAEDAKITIPKQEEKSDFEFSIEVRGKKNQAGGPLVFGSSESRVLSSNEDILAKSLFAQLDQNSETPIENAQLQSQLEKPAPLFQNGLPVQTKGTQPAEAPAPEENNEELLIPETEEKGGGKSTTLNTPEGSKIGTPKGSAKRPKKVNEDLYVVGRSNAVEPDSIFVQGVNKAIDDSVEKSDNVVQEELTDSSHLACIIVESNRFSGYLVAALGKDKKIDADFVELIRARLKDFLTKNGEPLDERNNLELKVRQVDFEGWALEYAQFLRKSVHKGDEVAMAFFPFANVKTEIGESENENMASISTDDIETEVPLEFNMYIYLPANKKYVLYTPQGGVFMKEQKDRLQRQGVKKMHIQKSDLQNVSKFKAQNQLNSLIKDFEAKSPAKKIKKTG